MGQRVLDQFSFQNQQECIAVIHFITRLMEASIQKGFFSRSNIVYQTEWDSDFTITVFQEILKQRVALKGARFPLIQDFTLIGNQNVSFTVTNEFYEFYLQNTSI